MPASALILLENKTDMNFEVKQVGTKQPVSLDSLSSMDYTWQPVTATCRRLMQFRSVEKKAVSTGTGSLLEERRASNSTASTSAQSKLQNYKCIVEIITAQAAW